MLIAPHFVTQKKVSCFVLLLLAVALSNKVAAQEPDPAFNCNSFSNALCTLNLTNPISGLGIDSTGPISYGGTIDNDFKDILYQKDKRKCDSTYNGGTICTPGASAATYNLVFQIFYPETYNGDSLKLCKMPAVILFHGGSFFECSQYVNPATKDVARELAKRGFLVFTVEYRRSVILHPTDKTPNGYQYLSAQQILGVYRACQDGRGAIRSIIQMSRDGTNGFGSTFTMDENNLFIGGFSAGSVIALAAAYYERQGQIDSAYANVGNAMDTIDAHWYVGSDTINYKRLIKGVVNLWGGLAMHKSYYGNPTAFFQTNNYNPPMIVFQGRYDSTFPVGTSYQYFSAKIKGGVNYQTETNCIVHGSSFKLPDDNPDPDMPTDNADAINIGAESFYTIFKGLGIRIEEHLDCQAGHGLDEKEDSTFQSDYGTHDTTQHDVYVYITGRIATYLVAIIKNAPSLPRKRFVECTNNRIKCGFNSNSTCGYTSADEDGASCE